EAFCGSRQALAVFLRTEQRQQSGLRSRSNEEAEMDLEGGCACGAVRYRLTAPPLIVHACHCRDCQKQTGSAFVLNIWIERSHVEADHSLPGSVMVKGGSAKPHQVFFCKDCGTRLWSKYHAAPGDTVLLRAGTLDQPETIAPDVHIFTRSKLPLFEVP